ncbi:hypothetical protein SBADM41S_11126 [Streptomyces badius]
MKIVVHDTASALLDLLHRPLAQRPDALREVFAPLQEVMSGVGVGDLVETHRAGSGFPIDRDDPRLLPALDRMRGPGCGGGSRTPSPPRGSCWARRRPRHGPPTPCTWSWCSATRTTR